MKIIIFAGGVGTRMWPLSRENSPKQFDKIFNGKSTLQLAFERVAPAFGAENIFVQTTKIFQKIIRQQLPKLPKNNLFIEPARRDVGAAVCFGINKLDKLDHTGPVAIVWADHLMDKVGEFTRALQAGEKLIEKDSRRFVFIAERPRFANNNLGWMKVGEKKGAIGKKDFFSFQGWKYRPEKAVCDQMFKSGVYFWNPGYFVSSVEFLMDCYRNLAPEIFRCVTKGKYEQCPKLHFDSAIIEKVDLSNAVVLKTNMGWSDPGTLYALKEALEKTSVDNVVKGGVVDFETSDSLVYNLEPGKIVATVGLKGMVIVNTGDAIVVAHKDNVVRISELVKEMKRRKLDKFL